MVEGEQFLNVDPARIAILFGEHRIDHGRFASDVAAMANWLRGQGVISGQSIGIFLKHPYWEWIANLAAMRLGVTVAVLTSKYAEEVAVAGGLNVCLADSTTEFKSTLVQRVVGFSPQNMLPLAQQFGLSTGAENSLVPLSDVPSRRLMFSSGTTGRPKGVVWDEQMLAKGIEITRSSQGLGKDSVLTSLLGTDTGVGFRYPLAVWQAGGCVLLRSGVPGSHRSGLTLSQLSTTNVILTSPVRLQECLRSFPRRWDGAAARKIVVVGGRLPVAVREEALKLACRTVSIAYGSTETGGISTGDSSLMDRHPGAVGFAMEGASIEIVDSNGKNRPTGQAGTVRTRTSYMASGYVGSAASADDQFRDAWFYPGDEGVLFADGLLAINGRLSETLNLMGVKYSTSDLEAKLAQLNSIREVCAVMMKVGDADALVFAAVTDDATAMRRLWHEIQAEIPLGVPMRLVRVPALPRNGMGKIERPTLVKRLTKFFANADSTQAIE